MSFLLDTLEDTLHLSDGDKAVINAALPTLHNWARLLNPEWDTLDDAVGWLCSSNAKGVAQRLLKSLRTLGPIAEDVLGGGGNLFEAGPAVGAVNDFKATVEGNPKMAAALTVDFNRLAPLVAQIYNDSSKPELHACVRLLQAKIEQHNVPVHVVAMRAIGATEPDDTRGRYWPLK